MEFIKVWCEYDFGGNFGGNNNQEVFSIPEHLSTSEVDTLVRKYLISATGVGDKDLDEDLYGWEDISVRYLGEHMITKFTDSDNNICYMQYIELGDCFIVCTEELPNVKHTFLPDEVEDYLDRGIWRRLS